MVSDGLRGWRPRVEEVELGCSRKDRVEGIVSFAIVAGENDLSGWQRVFVHYVVAVLAEENHRRVRIDGGEPLLLFWGLLGSSYEPVDGYTPEHDRGF